MLLMNNRRTIYINIAFFAVLCVGYLYVNFYSGAAGSSGAEPVVSFESAGLDRPLTPLDPNAKSLSVKDYRGSPLLLHFWASWCEPCVHDEKPFRDLFDAASGRGVRFVSVASEDQPKSIERLGKLKAYPGDSYVDPSGDLARAFNVKVYPYTVLIDKDGHVLFRGDGPLTDDDLKHLREEFTTGAAASLPSFSFPDDAGRPFASAALADKVWLADFIFTSCGDTCPMISEKLRAVQAEFAGNPNFRIVSFSVDPKNDTPERLREFGKQHGANPAVWSFLRPPGDSLRDLMVKGFHLGTLENPLVHTAKIVVVNKGNAVESYVDGDDPNAVAKLGDRLRKLLGP
jgi:protein SCO1/2